MMYRYTLCSVSEHLSCLGSSQTAPVYPVCKSTPGAFSVLHHLVRFSLPSWLAGPAGSDQADWSGLPRVSLSFLSEYVSSGHSSWCEASSPFHQHIIDRTSCTASSTPDFWSCMWMHTVLCVYVLYSGFQLRCFLWWCYRICIFGGCMSCLHRWVELPLLLLHRRVNPSSFLVSRMPPNVGLGWLASVCLRCWEWGGVSSEFLLLCWGFGWKVITRGILPEELFGPGWGRNRCCLVFSAAFSICWSMESAL